MGLSSPPLSPAERGPLGQYLWTLRKAADMTLREVEEACDRKVSNAYISQIETGRIPSPSPPILQKLSSVYEAKLPKNSPVACSFQRMMELAGHLQPRKEATAKRETRLPILESEQLTPEEEDELLKYLAFLRMRKGRK